MKRTIRFLLLATLMLIAVQINLLSAQAPLQSAGVLPALSGQTLSGSTLNLPAAAHGAPALVIFAFTHAAGSDTKLWTEHVQKDAPNLPVFTIIFLESAPKLVRGMAVAGIKSGIPPAQRDHTAILYADEALWKQRLAVTDDRRAYVVLLSPNGQINWSSTTAFSEAEFQKLENALPKTANQQ